MRRKNAHKNAYKYAQEVFGENQLKESLSTIYYKLVPNIEYKISLYKGKRTT